MNTPNVDNTEQLFDLAIGLRECLHGISWQGYGAAKVRHDIGDFVHSIRGEIVHKGTTPGKLDKRGVDAWINYFGRLVSVLDPDAPGGIPIYEGLTPESALVDGTYTAVLSTDRSDPLEVAITISNSHLVGLVSRGR